MYAARSSQFPSCEPLPSARRRIVDAASAAALVLALAAPAAAHAQDAGAQQRGARALSIIEGLLTDTITDAIEGTVQGVNAENARAEQRAREDGETPELRYVIRHSGQTRVRGMFLEDYGVIFTVQVPNLSYSHSALVELGRSGSIPLIGPDGTRQMVGPSVAAEAQFRNQMNRMRYEINELTRRLENEVAISGAGSANAEQLRALREALQASFNAYAQEAERVALTPVADQPGANTEPPTDRPGRSAISIISSASPEEVARAEGLAIQQKSQVEGAVITAIVDSLSYGHILNGLGDDDRLAVVILPSSYLNQVVSWARATQRDEEYIISVSFRDVRDLADGEMSTEEFGGKLRIETRLGPAGQAR